MHICTYIYYWMIKLIKHSLRGYQDSMVVNFLVVEVPGSASYVAIFTQDLAGFNIQTRNNFFKYEKYDYFIMCQCKCISSLHPCEYRKIRE